MNAYFMKVTKEERENILDKHKSLYDGYAVRNNTPAEQPLYVQDLANDKGGITLDNKGNVGQYNNKIYMKESKGMCEQCGMGEMYEGKCSKCGYQMEDIYDVSKGFPKTKEGKPETQSFDYVESECMECMDSKGMKLDMIGDGEDDLEHGTYGHHEDESEEDIILAIFDDEDLEEDEILSIKESVSKSLDWFRKFEKYN